MWGSVVCIVTLYSVVMIMYTVCMVLLVSIVTAREILAHDHDDGDDRAGGGGRIGGVLDTLGYVAPLLRMLSYLVGMVVHKFMFYY